MLQSIKSLIIFAALLFCTGPLFAAVDTYKFDPGHTYVLWYVSHFGFTQITGKFMASGTLLLDESAQQNSKVTITIDTTKPNTGIPDLDDLLTGKNFFNTAQYPTATFTSNKIVRSWSKPSTVKVYGTLTIRGVSKPVVLDVTLNKNGLHPYYNVNAVGFTADATLKRSDFGITAYLPGISDDVKLYIQAEAEINKGNEQTQNPGVHP